MALGVLQLGLRGRLAAAGLLKSPPPISIGLIFPGESEKFPILFIIWFPL